MANVLIVDDDSDILDLCGDLLESAGHQVKRGHNGEQGLKCLDAGPLPECVVLDVDMPVLSGPAMAHQMLLHDAGEEKIPILLVSGREDLPQVAGRMGTPYFLKKACADYGTLLLKIVAQAVRERQAPAAAWVVTKRWVSAFAGTDLELVLRANGIETAVNIDGSTVVEPAP
jgi:FixJ family two-component response regulator